MQAVSAGPETCPEADAAAHAFLLTRGLAADAGGAEGWCRGDDQNQRTKPFCVPPHSRRCSSLWDGHHIHVTGTSSSPNRPAVEAKRLARRIEALGYTVSLIELAA